MNGLIRKTVSLSTVSPQDTRTAHIIIHWLCFVLCLVQILINSAIWLCRSCQAGWGQLLGRHFLVPPVMSRTLTKVWHSSGVLAVCRRSLFCWRVDHWIMLSFGPFSSSSCCHLFAWLWYQAGDERRRCSSRHDDIIQVYATDTSQRRGSRTTCELPTHVQST